jgi:hypothetical protein
MFGINLINIAIYLIYFICNKKIDFFDNEKFYKLQKKLNDSLTSEKSKKFKEICNHLNKKLTGMETVADHSKDFKDWIKMKLPNTFDDFEIIELKHLIELSLNYRNRNEYITMSETNLIKITQLIKQCNKLFFYTEKNEFNQNHHIKVSECLKKVKDKFRFKSMSRTSKRVVKSSDKRKNLELMKKEIFERKSQKESENINPNSKSEEENKNNDSFSSDDGGHENEENTFQLNNQIFSDFTSQLDKEYNYISYLEKNLHNSEYEITEKNILNKKYNIQIWRFKLFAYSLEKIKKCKICKAFLPEYICESGQDIIPYFSENKNNRGLIK